MTSLVKKVMYIILLLSILTNRLSAPSRESTIIFGPAPVNPYTELIYAIGMVETGCDTLAYNPIEEAAGFLQIRPIRLEDYNKRTGSNIKSRDLYNYEISKKIFLYYAEKIGPYDFEKIARKWNGSGHSTIHYWTRIKKYL
jgi:hypothetical protein